MCNLYSVRSTQEELRLAFQVRNEYDRLGNWPGKNAVFPDGEAPVVRAAEDGEREMLTMRWGMPGPVKFGGYPVTNIRNPTSPHWRAWMKPEYRCLVPATAFCEPTASKPCVWHWFGRGQERTPFAFAGIWRPWMGQRGTKGNPIIGDHLLFSFLTTDPNEIVWPIHQKAMPVLLTTAEEFDFWLRGPTEEVLKLQRPAPMQLIEIIARGEKQDPPADAAAAAPMQGALL